MYGLVDRVNVYTSNNVNGVYDVLAKTRLHCRIEHIGGGQTQQDRAALAELRHIVFEGNYEMPEDCEIQRVNPDDSLEGPRYNPLAGTFAHHRGTNSRKIFRAVDVVQVNG